MTRGATATQAGKFRRDVLIGAGAAMGGGGTAGAAGEAIAVDGPPALLLVVAIVLLVALVAALWRERGRLYALQRTYAARIEVLLAALDAAPLASAVRGPGRQVLHASPALADGTSAGIAAALGALVGPAEAARAASAMARLEADGAAFDLVLAGVQAGHEFVFGGRAQRASDGRDLGATLWLRDASAEAAEKRALAHALDESLAAAASLRDILDAVPLPLWRRDRSGRIVACNATYAGSVEATPADVLARGIELAPAAGRVGEPAEADPGARDVRRHVVIGGQRRLLRILETPVEGGSVGVARDVTDVEDAQSELKRHVTAHGEVLETLATAVAIFGADMRLQFFNSAFTRTWDLDAAWLAGGPSVPEIIEALRQYRRLPEPSNWREFKERETRLFTSLTQAQEQELYLPDGRVLRRVVSPHPFGGLLFLWEDVTERRDLQRSQDTLIAVQRATLDNLYEAVAVFGSDGRLSLYNSAFARAWRLPEEALGNGPHVSWFLESTKALHDHGEDWEAYKAEMIDAAASRTPRFTRMERTDGAVLDWASVPLPDGATLMIFLDVTDSIEVERALRDRNEALEAAARLKSEFIANVSHELRTPLNSVIGFTEILRNEYFGPLNDRQMEYAEGVFVASTQLLAIINDILDLASIEAGQMVIERHQVNVYASLASVLALAQERVRNKALDLTLDCPSDVGTLYADGRRLRQVVFHLLSNAIKFTDSGGHITVGARREGGRMVIWVADTGIGIDPVEQARVFEKFQRSANAHNLAGTGLGLSLVKNFVELHGGQVVLESTPGQGTRVTCYFPDEDGQAEASAAAQSA